jgi:hypothetical protein
VNFAIKIRKVIYLKYYFGRLIFYIYLIFFKPATGLFYSLPFQQYRNNVTNNLCSYRNYPILSRYKHNIYME